MDESSFVQCQQCRVTTYPHFHCRCLLCGLIHSHTRGCRGPVFCQQCCETADRHTFCYCVLCNHSHQTGRPCRQRAQPARFAAGCINCSDSMAVHVASDMSDVCVHCESRSWPGETMNCCDRGAVVLPHFPVAPPALTALLGLSHMHVNLRAYNMAMCMASVGHHSKGLTYGSFVLGGKIGRAHV